MSNIELCVCRLRNRDTAQEWVNKFHASEFGLAGHGLAISVAGNDVPRVLELQETFRSTVHEMPYGLIAAMNKVINEKFPSLLEEAMSRMEDELKQAATDIRPDLEKLMSLTSSQDQS